MTPRILCALLVASLAVTACEEGDTIIENPTDPAVCGDAICSVGETAVNCPTDCSTPPVQFSLGGNCGAQPGTCTVFCNDDSRPATAISNVVFTFFQGQVNLGSRQTTAGGQVSFTVSAPGSYTARQLVEATDGGAKDTNYPVTVVGDGSGVCP